MSVTEYSRGAQSGPNECCDLSDGLLISDSFIKGFRLEIMKKFIYQILMVLAIGAGFIACDSDDDYQPGAPTPANSMQVYFDADNTADYVCGPMGTAVDGIEGVSCE